MAVTVTLTFCGPLADRAYAGDSLETAGDILRFAIPVTGGLISVQKRDTDGLWQWGATWAVSAGITQGLKYGLDDTGWGERPDGGSRSFPSGHASSAAAGAGYLHFRYGWEYGLPAAALTGLVAYSRVESREHHPRDVVAGALIGYGAAFLLTDMQSDKVSVMPFAEIGKPSFGIVARLRF